MAEQHPYQYAIPAEFKDRDRWFLLTTDLTPPRPWKLDPAIPVFAMALELGEPGTRRWLIYAHSPLGDRAGVTITLPGFGAVKADVSRAGSFILVDEKSKSVNPH